MTHSLYLLSVSFSPIFAGVLRLPTRAHTYAHRFLQGVLRMPTRWCATQRQRTTAQATVKRKRARKRWRRLCAPSGMTKTFSARIRVVILSRCWPCLPLCLFACFARPRAPPRGPVAVSACDLRGCASIVRGFMCVARGRMCVACELLQGRRHKQVLGPRPGV
jgi:hypothetical protein